MSSTPANPKRPIVRVFVATTVLLSFISFWRAAAIVLSDLGSSAYYVGGDAEKVIGKSAPWFILAVMLFANCVRALYIESTSMFVRGGVYRVVRRAMGNTLAKFSVSALLFDYVLTGPLSSVVAGQYLAGFIQDISHYVGHPFQHFPDNAFAAGFGIVVTIYFWWKNTQGLHESSEKALQIMIVTTVMVVILIIWCTITLFHSPVQLPPSPLRHGIMLNKESLGWLVSLKNSWISHLTLFIVFVGFGHSVLAMSGEETLAQVNREIAHPKLKNLKKAAVVIGIYALLFTALTSFFAVMIIPDSVRPAYFGNLISGIAMHLWGPPWARLIFHAFVVLVGVLILSGAQNTSIVGANGVLNRVSEDGVVSDWFRAPHQRYGTTYRLIALIVILQLLTIIGSRGDIYMLGEAYAFGVIWSFAFKALAVLVLRFKDPSPREWKVPLNLPLGGRELPIGLGLITVLLFAIAGINLLTKQVATISGAAFTLVFFSLFLVSEWLSERWRGQAHVELDQFQLQLQEDVSAQTLEVHPRNILCTVRDYNNLTHVQRVLERTDTSRQDVVVMTVRLLQGPSTGYRDIDERELFTTYEQRLFSRVVALAEKVGKHVALLVAPATDIFQATVLTAVQLDSVEIVAGRSAVMTPTEQARHLGRVWENLPNRPRRQLRFRVIGPDGKTHVFYLGAHTPQLSEDDVELIHRLWLDLTQESGKEGAHHRDVVHLALRHLADDLTGPAHDTLVATFAPRPTRRTRAQQEGQQDESER